MMMWSSLVCILACLVAAAEDAGRPISPFITYHETLDYSTTAHITKHAAAMRGEYLRPWLLIFAAHNRTFHLQLERIIEDSVSEYDREILVVQGETQNGRVFGVIHDDGVFSGFITFSGKDTFWIERVDDYVNKSTLGKHSIIFAEKNVELPVGNETHPFRFCGTEHVERSVNTDLKFESRYGGVFSGENRVRRNAPAENSSPFFCPMKISVDQRLWKATRKDQESAESTKKYFISKARILIKSASLVYSKTTFVDTLNDRRITNMQFSLKDIKFYTPEFCAKFDRNDKSHPLCTGDFESKEFLEAYAKFDHHGYCASFAFTSLVFQHGTIGIAYVPKEGRSGICANKQNTGIITFFVSHHKKTLIPLMKLGLTLAHEIGHLCGSNHDDDEVNMEFAAQCNPQGSLSKKFLMFSRAVSGVHSKTNDQFSMCSKRDMSVKIGDLYGTSCFKTKAQALCGNVIREKNEACDCGPTHSCSDTCCNSSDKPKGVACTLKKGAVCSVSGHLLDNKCCNKKTCQPMSNVPCHEETSCKLQAFCDPKSAKCLPPKNKPDSTLCNDNRKTCIKGECLGSLCEFVQGWKECSHEKFPCFLSCQKGGNGKCISSKLVAEDTELQKQHASDMTLLLRKWKEGSGGKSTKLEPIKKYAGEPCDGSSGFCDRNGFCTIVESRTLIEKLKSFMGKTTNVFKIGNYMFTKWWASLCAFCLICAISVLMLLFFGRDSGPLLIRIHQAARQRRRQRIEGTPLTTLEPPADVPEAEATLHDSSTAFVRGVRLNSKDGAMSAAYPMPFNDRKSVRTRLSSWKNNLLGRKTFSAGAVDGRSSKPAPEALPTPRSLSFQTIM